jgi:hypothetical protein
MAELLAFVQAVGVPAAISFVLIFHTGRRLENLTKAILSLGSRIAICPFQPKANPGQEEKQP